MPGSLRFIRRDDATVDVGRAHPDGRTDQHQVILRGQRHRLNLLAPPATDRGREMVEERHVAADLRGQGVQPLRGHLQVPESIQGYQGRRGIARAAAQASLRGDRLRQVDACPTPAARLLAESSGRTGPQGCPLRPARPDRCTAGGSRPSARPGSSTRRRAQCRPSRSRSRDSRQTDAPEPQGTGLTSPARGLPRRRRSIAFSSHPHLEPGRTRRATPGPRGLGSSIARPLPSRELRSSTSSFLSVGTSGRT